MRKITGCLALLLVSTTLSAAQSQKAQTPTQAIATIAGQTSYVAGQGKVTLLLKLQPAPKNLQGGYVQVFFHNTTENHVRFDSSTDDIAERLPLVDGEANYTFEFDVNISMTGGVWKLQLIRAGNAVLNSLPIPPNVTFTVERPERPITVQIEGPKAVRNGDAATFKMIVSDVPHEIPRQDPMETCTSTVGASFSQIDGTGAPYGVDGQSFEVNEGTHEFTVNFHLAPDSPHIGKWKITAATSRMGRPSKCGEPPLPINGGQFGFETVRPTDVVVPTSVEVALNPNQIQLLKAQAENLRTRVDALRYQLSSSKDREQLLRKTVNDALTELRQTHAQFNALASNSDEASLVVFQDIEWTYEDTLKKLEAINSQPTYFQPVSAGAAAPHNIKGENSVVRAMTHHAAVFDKAAESGVLKIPELDIRSTPQGALISLRRKYDDFKDYHDQTDTVIKNLDIAIWYIRFRKGGCAEKTITYDAATDDPVLVVPLEPQDKSSQCR